MDTFNAAVLPHSSSYLAQLKWFIDSQLISVRFPRMLHGFLAYSLDVQPTNFYWGGSSLGVAVAGDPIRPHKQRWKYLPPYLSVDPGSHNVLETDSSSTGRDSYIRNPRSRDRHGVFLWSTLYRFADFFFLRGLCLSTGGIRDSRNLGHPGIEFILSLTHAGPFLAM